MSRINVRDLEVLAPRWGAILGSLLFWIFAAAHPLLIVAFLLVAFALGCMILAEAGAHENQPPETALHV